MDKVRHHGECDEQPSNRECEAKGVEPNHKVISNPSGATRVDLNQSPRRTAVEHPYWSEGFSLGDWLVKQFTLWGSMPLQNWMLLALATILVSIMVAWFSRP